jgi:hypothetical protein
MTGDEAGGIPNPGFGGIGNLFSYSGNEMENSRPNRMVPPQDT